MKDSDWKTLKSTTEYENPYMRIIRHDVVRPNDLAGPYFVLQRHPFSVVIPLTGTNETYLVGQYRYPISQYSWEFPMGSVIGKNQLEIAQQELVEETGLQALEWEEIGQFAVAPGHSSQIAKLFVARNLEQHLPKPEIGEILETKKISLTDLSRLITDGAIIDGVTICSYKLLEVYLEKKL